MKCFIKYYKIVKIILQNPILTTRRFLKPEKVYFENDVAQKSTLFPKSGSTDNVAIESKEELYTQESDLSYYYGNYQELSRVYTHLYINGLYSNFYINLYI